MDKLRIMSRGNAQFEEKMFRLFQEQTAARLIELEKEANNANFRQVGEIAHKMKPALDSFCVDSLHETVRRLEKATEHPAEQNHSDMVQLLQVLRKVLAEMAQGNN